MCTRSQGKTERKKGSIPFGEDRMTTTFPSYKRVQNLCIVMAEELEIKSKNQMRKIRTPDDE